MSINPVYRAYKSETISIQNHRLIRSIQRIFENLFIFKILILSFHLRFRSKSRIMKGKFFFGDVAIEPFII
jgi:hypothetical protein